MHACMHACMYLCMYACMHACMYVSMYVCMHACTQVLSETLVKGGCNVVSGGTDSHLILVDLRPKVYACMYVFIFANARH